MQPKRSPRFPRSPSATTTTSSLIPLLPKSSPVSTAIRLAAVAVQGYQLFDVDHTTGTATSPDVVGTFDGDVTTTVNYAGNQSETLLVTSDVSGTPGTAAGDVPLPGSVIDTSTFGDSGLENIYSDLASTTPGIDVISDTLVTPIGDLTIPLHVDLFANLAADMFTIF